LADVDPSKLVVERLTKDHDREGFNCGVEALNSFLQKQARKEMERRAAVCYVCVVPKQPKEIIGFYSLSSTTILLDTLPDFVTKKLGRYPSVPATLLGRLAVDKKHQGRGIGPLLLREALLFSAQKSTEIGSVAVIVDAKDEKAAGFYEIYGFRRLSDDPLRLFMMMPTIEAAFADKPVKIR
jgi:ribosomal protein S18 acetylase RimI-like enzyme